MTTISSNSAALTSLVSLYAGENGTASASNPKLTSDQLGGIESMIEGGAGSSTTGLSALLGTSSTTTSPGDMSSILDAITAQTTAGTATASGSTGTSTATATTQQQKAAALMQSVYQSQQSSLFTLLG